MMDNFGIGYFLGSTLGKNLESKPDEEEIRKDEREKVLDKHGVGKQFTEKHLRMRGEWLVCDVCRMHKEGVQIRRKHCKGQWVCNDCYAKQIEKDKVFIETLGQTKTQWKRRKRNEKGVDQP